MKKIKWIISSKEIDSDLTIVCNYGFVVQVNNLNIHFSISGKSVGIIIDGYILPRNYCFEKYKKYSQYELIEKLYYEHKENLINYIKGAFNLIIVEDDSFYVFNDNLSIKKFFYYADNDNFIISNDIELIRKRIKTEIDINQIAISSLFHHYLFGKTIFSNIRYSLPAQKITHKDELKIDTYWNFEKLIKDDVKEMEAEEFGDEFAQILKNYITYLKPKNISQTLTGGLDSRTILSALLNHKIKPRAYTYGNPESRDVIYAKRVADELNLNYKNHYPNLSSRWFLKYANLILKEGNTLCSVHRAHRLDAIKNSVASKDEMLIGGYMGNETIRGLSYDDLIISKFLRKWWTSYIDKKELIKQTLEEYFFDSDKFDIDIILNAISSFNFIKNDERINHFYATFEIKAANHHYQDPYLFSNFVKYPLPIFMDIDLLELIFSSNHNILYLKKKENFIDRVKAHEFNLKIISHLAPELDDLPFGKNGYYTINEYNSNKILLYLKRFIRQKTEKKYPANFVLGDWLQDYIKESLDIVKKNQTINSLIDFDKMQESLKSEKSTNEKELLRYTNLISLSKIIGKNEIYIGNIKKRK